MPPEPRRSDATRAAILEAAQEHFASVGYEKATIRAIAGTAGIDPSLVMRYYGNKGKLFAAAANFDLCLPELSAVSHEELGTVIVQHFLERWEVDDTMVALLRAAVSNEEARLRMVEIFTDQSLPAFEELLTDPCRRACRAHRRPNDRIRRLPLHSAAQPRHRNDAPGHRELDGTDRSAVHRHPCALTGRQDRTFNAPCSSTSEK